MYERHILYILNKEYNILCGLYIKVIFNKQIIAKGNYLEKQKHLL